MSFDTPAFNTLPMGGMGAAWPPTYFSTGFPTIPPPPAITPPSSDSVLSATTNRRVRSKYTDKQLRGLERRFRKDQYPDQKTRELIAMELGITSNQIKVWFKNRRAKHRQDLQQRPPPEFVKTTAADDERPDSTGSVSSGEDKPNPELAKTCEEMWMKARAKMYGWNITEMPPFAAQENKASAPPHMIPQQPASALPPPPAVQTQPQQMMNPWMFQSPQPMPSAPQNWDMGYWSQQPTPEQPNNSSVYSSVYSTPGQFQGSFDFSMTSYGSPWYGSTPGFMPPPLVQQQPSCELEKQPVSDETGDSGHEDGEQEDEGDEPQEQNNDEQESNTLSAENL